MPANQDRPSSGNWLENRSVVRHTPDAVVLINGYEEFATCPSCNRSLNLQQYITSVDADASTEMSANANFSVTIPQYEMSRFMRDGVPILQPSLEVVIFMRGYFPMKGFADLGQESTADFDAGQVPVYPYYQVFRGVVTNVSHSYSGGFYSATVQCANFLHFWQTQYISTNGSVFGSRPKGSMVEPSLIGSKLTGMGPYDIIYTLVKATFGAAYGVEFKYSNTSDVQAEDVSGSKNLYTHAAEWWAKNFSKNQGSLRMYGADGGLFNIAQQAFLGAWSSIGKERFNRIASRVYTVLKNEGTKKPFSSETVLKTLRQNLFNQISTVQAIASDEGGNTSAINVLKMQAFILDIGKMGQVNLFESEYMTKSQIAQEVLNITGYEFYQDVDGDLVFKPPMYNMDTSSDPIYTIEDRDLISISESETEPEATMVKATGSHFANLAGHGVEGWMGVGAVFIDYRLVAKFGYKEETFESNYLSSRHALYISCVNRLDLANVGVKSATITIPLRPEMRAGYPIYVRSLDCFYYAKSISHSFAFNGQCTSSITCVAKRSKWFPPMSATSGGELPSISNVKLGSPGEFPQRPLMAYPQYLNAGNASGPPQAVGFPNVVLALDTTKVNIDSVDIPRSVLTPESYVELALSKGILQRDPDSPQRYILRSGQFTGETVTLQEVQQGYVNVDAALAAGTLTPEPTDAFGKILVEVEKIYGTINSNDVKKLVNYLALQTSLKSYYAPGVDILGKYRYYSCSHPNKDDQAPKNLNIDLVNPSSTIDEAPGKPEVTEAVQTLTDVGNGKGVKVELLEPVAGIKIANITNLGATKKNTEDVITVPTSHIRFVTAGPQFKNNIDTVSTVKESWNEGKNFRLAVNQTQNAFKRLISTYSINDLALTFQERLSGEYLRIFDLIGQFAQSCGVATDPSVVKSQKIAQGAISRGDLLKNSSQLNSNQDDKSVISSFSETLSKNLWPYVETVIERTIKVQKVQVTGKTGPETQRSTQYDSLMAYRAQFIREYSRGALIVPDSAPAYIYDTNGISQTKSISWTPIYPVSDSAGYEVFGNLPYGRGVNIEKYGALLQSSKHVPKDPNMDGAEKAALSKTNIQNYGINASSMEVIEQFLIAWAVTEGIGGKPNAAQIFNNTSLFSEDDKAAGLATLNTSDPQELQGLVEAILKGQTSEYAFIRNKPVTSFFRGQSLTGEAAAENLARITYGESVCYCQGSDALFLVQALSEESRDLYGEDPLVPWMKEEVYQPLQEISDYTKKALAGEYLDTRNNNLAEQFTAEGDVARAYTEEVANLRAGVAAAQNQGQ